MHKQKDKAPSVERDAALGVGCGQRAFPPERSQKGDHHLVDNPVS